MLSDKKDDRLTVMAVLESKPGKENMLRDALLQQALKIYQETGYIRFDLHQSNDNPAIFTLYEIWQNETVLATHFEQPHTKLLLQQFEELLAGPFQVWQLTRITPLV
jgi:quinol monooxygenase YgiN